MDGRKEGHPKISVARNPEPKKMSFVARTLEIELSLWVLWEVADPGAIPGGASLIAGYLKSSDHASPGIWEEGVGFRQSTKLMELKMNVATNQGTWRPPRAESDSCSAASKKVQTSALQPCETAICY